MIRRFAIALLLIVAATRCARAAERPNIVFVLADDMGPGDLACYGGTVAPTPHIDRLAAEGTRFTQYYSASPICSPSRVGCTTGMFPARWQITSFLQERKGNRACEQADFLDPRAPSVARLLKTAGYATAHFGKWHMGGGRDVTDAPKFAAYGFDEHAGTWESPEPHPDITATNWIWSPQDKVKRWDRTAFFVDRDARFSETPQRPAAPSSTSGSTTSTRRGCPTKWLRPTRTRKDTPEHAAESAGRNRPANRPAARRPPRTGNRRAHAGHLCQRQRRAADVPRPALGRPSRQQAQPLRRRHPPAVYRPLAGACARRPRR